MFDGDESCMRCTTTLSDHPPVLNNDMAHTWHRWKRERMRVCVCMRVHVRLFCRLNDFRRPKMIFLVWLWLFLFPMSESSNGENR